MTVIAKVINKLQQYQQNIREEGLIVGLGINFEDIVGKLYLGLIFHRLDGTLGGAAKIRGRKNIHIGAHFTCGKYLRIEAIKQYNEKNSNVRPQIIIKDNVSFNDFTHIGAVNCVEIGNHVLFGSKCYVTDHNHGIYSGEETQSDPNIPPSERPLNCNQKVVIGDNVWLGDNVTVLPGVTIGKGSIIGSNAVVSKSIPQYSIAVGIPARVVKKWNPVYKQWEKTEGEKI